MIRRHPINLIFFTIAILCACNKHVNTTEPSFTTYTIKEGQHFTGQEKIIIVETKALRFIVKFDSSCVYKTVSINNQHDINKLYGFSDNKAEHHAFSARFGWRWYKNSLTLQAYIYNDSVMHSKDIAAIDIGREYNCAIIVQDTNYIFTLDKVTLSMPRTSKTKLAEGYKLFPYFGGDEVAPHDINIYIKDLP